MKQPASPWLSLLASLVAGVALFAPRPLVAGEPPAFRLRELQTRYLWAEREGCELFLGVEQRSEQPALRLKVEQERCPLPFSARRAGLDALWQRLLRARGGAAPRVAAVAAPMYPEAADRLARAALASPGWRRHVQQGRRGAASAALVLELLQASAAYAELQALLRSWGQDCAVGHVEKIAELRGPMRGPSRPRAHPAEQWLPPLPRGMRVPFPLIVSLDCKPAAAASTD
ncbi:MAG: hypothetical protein IPL40_08035 [Proteobacteria bacterium]|nr:hypothetical protein [Pseudomonadota bacterium]